MREIRSEGGEAQMEYVLVAAVMVPAMVIAARALWRVLLHYFSLHALVIDLPFF